MLQKRSFNLRNMKKEKKMRRINVTNAIKLTKKFKALLVGESFFIKHSRNPIQDYTIKYE